MYETSSLTLAPPEYFVKLASLFHDNRPVRRSYPSMSLYSGAAVVVLVAPSHAHGQSTPDKPIKSTRASVFLLTCSLL